MLVIFFLNYQKIYFRVPKIESLPVWDIYFLVEQIYDLINGNILCEEVSQPGEELIFATGFVLLFCRFCSDLPTVAIMSLEIIQYADTWVYFGVLIRFNRWQHAMIKATFKQGRRHH